MTNQSSNHLLTVAEIAEELRVSKMTVYRLIHDGELAHVRVGRGYRVPQPSFDEYIAVNTYQVALR
jgi:excisionase family DNA binding protein